MNANEANGIITSIFDAFGQDYNSMGLLVYHLRINVPGVNWQTYITAKASTYQPFIDSGLSIDWWVAEVMRQADLIRE